MKTLTFHKNADGTWSYDVFDVMGDFVRTVTVHARSATAAYARALGMVRISDHIKPHIDINV